MECCVVSSNIKSMGEECAYPELVPVRCPSFETPLHAGIILLDQQLCLL